MTTTLPNGWTSLTLGEIGKWGSGGTPSRSNSSFYIGSIPWFKTGELGPRVIYKSEESISEEAIKASSAKLFPAGSIALAMYGATIGKTSILGVDAATNQACAVVIEDNRIVNKEYLFNYLKSQKDGFIAAGQGGAQPNISQTVIKAWPIPLAPLNEQRRIADKLDTTLARVDALNDRLARITPLLKRFRQSVLAAATSGRLTEDWRILQQEFSKKSAKAELARLKETQNGKLKIRGHLPKFSEDLLYELPIGWDWVSNYELAKDVENSICAGPFGTIFKAHDFRESGVPIVFLRHIGEGAYLTHKPTYMDIDVWERLHQPYSIFGGELLVTKLGDPPGTACIYPSQLGVAMVTPDVLKMDVNADAVEAKYLMNYFNSTNSKKIIRELCFGVTRLRIDMAMFKLFPIPLPPREEQTEIVRRVETLFAFADRLEARLQSAQAAAERLTPALLAKAFRGELVPQDPNDEPATELLRRLRDARAAQAAAKAKRKKQ